jgi:RNA polymerase sigma factor (TIGR02999 family)
MRKERADHTLQTTALVHEAYVRLFRGESFRWENRKHFYCAMAQAMRRVLVDHARERVAEKRKKPHKPTFHHGPAEPPQSEIKPDIMALDQALQRLGKRNPRQAQVIELRFFVGLTADQTAAILDISAETVKLDWRFAKAWLGSQIRPASNDVL